MIEGVTRSENCGLYSLLEECVQILVGIGTRDEGKKIERALETIITFCLLEKIWRACFGRRTHHHPHH